MVTDDSGQILVSGDVLPWEDVAMIALARTCAEDGCGPLAI